MSISNVSSVNGSFTVTDSAGLQKTISFAELVMSMGMTQLELQDTYFEEQYKKVADLAEEMREVNTMIAMLTSYKNSFDADGKVTDNKSKTCSSCAEFSTADMKTWKSTYYGNYSQSGKIADTNGDKSTVGVGSDGIFTHQELTTFITNAEAYQKNLTSLNEQEMMVTNQAASRRTNVLQQLQTLLASEKEGRNAAAR
ncbi:MAG: hypothetical protein R3Y11_03310 [Pseudomonadota bacterium]